MEHSCTGTCSSTSPDDALCDVVMGGLCFPNGVALSGDQSRALHAETGEYRIWKVDVDADSFDARAAARHRAPRKSR